MTQKLSPARCRKLEREAAERKAFLAGAKDGYSKGLKRAFAGMKRHDKGKIPAHTFADACKNLKVSEFGISIPYLYNEADTFATEVMRQNMHRAMEAQAHAFDALIADSFAVGFDVTREMWNDSRYDLFTVQAQPGETREHCKARLHAENYTMAKSKSKRKPARTIADNYRWEPASFTFEPVKPKKPPVARTKREHALVDHARKNAYEAGYNDGRKQGVELGAQTERKRGDELILRAFAAVAAARKSDD